MRLDRLSDELSMYKHCASHSQRSSLVHLLTQVTCDTNVSIFRYGAKWYTKHMLSWFQTEYNPYA